MNLASTIRRVKAETVRVRSLLPAGVAPVWSHYRADPIGYAADILGVTLTPDQATILQHLLIPPCRVLVPSGHDTGKTFLAAVAVNWWYDNFNPGAVFTIGPRHDSLKDTLWSAVRLQRLAAKVRLPWDFIGPAAPEMRSAPDHWAKGLTASKDSSLTGRHLPNMLFVIEEAIGVDPVYWHVIKTMFDPALGHAQLCIFNPTDTTSQAYIEDQGSSAPDGSIVWHKFRLSVLNHPNVLAELDGLPKPIPHAVGLAMVNEMVRDWCEPVRPGDEKPTDFRWPPKTGPHYRPLPEMQCRALGLWPDVGLGVWSEAVWELCVNRDRPAQDCTTLPKLGLDTATGKGDDYHAIHARWGMASFHHETSNTMDPVRICERVKAVCQLAADRFNRHDHPNAAPAKPTDIEVRIDDDGTGNAIGAFLRADGYKAICIGAGTVAADPTKYPNKRSELWFQTPAKAKLGQVYLGGLDVATLRRLKQQAMAPTWALDNAGRRKVEPKDDTKEKIGRSPDDMDAVNLAYLDDIAIAPPPLPERPKRDIQPHGRPSRSLFGR